MEFVGYLALGAAVAGSFFATAILLGRRWDVPISWPQFKAPQQTIPPTRKRVGGIVVGVLLVVVGAALVVVLTSYLGCYLWQARWFGVVGGLVIAPALAALAVRLARSVRP